MKYNIYLFPSKFKWFGTIILLPGIILAYLKLHLDIRWEFLNTKVFAIYSTYLESKYFSIIQNNLAEEISGVLIILGLTFISFSKIKDENEETLRIRLESLLEAVYINTILLILSFFLFYGIAFLKIMAINLVSLPIIFLIRFWIKLRILKRSKL